MRNVQNSSFLLLIHTYGNIALTSSTKTNIANYHQNHAILFEYKFTNDKPILNCALKYLPIKALSSSFVHAKIHSLSKQKLLNKLFPTADLVMGLINTNNFVKYIF